MSKVLHRTIHDITQGQNKETINYFIIAEQICRKKYEQVFGYNLNLSIGHSKNNLGKSEEDIKQQLFKIMFFWLDFKQQTEKANIKHRVHLSIIDICNRQINGIIKILSL